MLFSDEQRRVGHDQRREHGDEEDPVFGRPRLTVHCGIAPRRRRAEEEEEGRRSGGAVDGRVLDALVELDSFGGEPIGTSVRDRVVDVFGNAGYLADF